MRKAGKRARVLVKKGRAKTYLKVGDSKRNQELGIELKDTKRSRECLLQRAFVTARSSGDTKVIQIPQLGSGLGVAMGRHPVGSGNALDLRQQARVVRRAGKGRLTTD